MVLKDANDPLGSLECRGAAGRAGCSTKVKSSQVALMSAILCCGEVWLSVTVLRKDTNGPLGSLECSGPAGSAGCSAIVKSSKWLTCAVL